MSQTLDRFRSSTWGWLRGTLAGWGTLLLVPIGAVGSFVTGALFPLGFVALAALIAAVKWFQNLATTYEVTEDRLILHFLNGTGVDNGNEMSDRTHPTGPLQIRVRVPAATKGSVRLLAAERTIPARLQGGVLQFTLDSLNDYEVAVLE